MTMVVGSVGFHTNGTTDRTIGGSSSSALLYCNDRLPALVLSRTKPWSRVVTHSSWVWGCSRANGNNDKRTHSIETNPPAQATVNCGSTHPWHGESITRCAVHSQDRVP